MLQIIGRVQDYQSIDELAEKDPPPSWKHIFQQALPEIQHASQSASRLGPFFPPLKDVFKAFDLCLFPPRVVIIGQDPYHSVDQGEPQACGLAFATKRSSPLQPSVRNIYNEIAQEFPGFEIPPHGDLTEWANQGVLLLNTCLTVMPHKPKSHMRGEGTHIWSGFIDKVLSGIAEANPECIYLLWGSDAQKLIPSLNQRSIKLLASHPSPFSAYRKTKEAPAFFGCNHFQLTNQELIRQGKQPINWVNLSR